MVVRAHPRHQESAMKLKNSLSKTEAIYLSFNEVSFQNFCSICDIITTFESTALLYAVRYQNYAFQVNIGNLNEPENNFNDILDIPIVTNEEEIIRELESCLHKNKLGFNAPNDKNFCVSNGKDSAEILFKTIKKIIA